jgi:hypothetical protein
MRHSKMRLTLSCCRCLVLFAIHPSTGGGWGAGGARAHEAVRAVHASVLQQDCRALENLTAGDDFLASFCAPPLARSGSPWTATPA